MKGEIDFEEKIFFSEVATDATCNLDTFRWSEEGIDDIEELSSNSLKLKDSLHIVMLSISN